MKKSFTAAALAGLMVLSSVHVPAMAAISFSDINNVPWEGAKAYIQEVADANIMVGENDAQGNRVFRPKDNLSYVEGVQLAYSLLKNNNALESNERFSNKWKAVMDSYSIPEWAYESVSYCLEQDIVKMSDLSKFYTNGKANPAPREDVCLFFGRALGTIMDVPSTATFTFKDALNISSSAGKYVQLLVDKGIIVGDDQNNFNPKNNMNRAELAVVVSKTNKVLSDGGKNETPVTPVVPVQTNVITGMVTNIATFGPDYIISVLSGNEAKGFMISSSAPITNADGTPITAASIKEGDEVQITYNENTATKVVKTANSSVLMGYISHITIDQVTVQDENGNESTYGIAANAQVLINDLKSTVEKLTQIYEDEYLNARLRFDEEGRVNLFDIDSKNSTSYGQIKELSKTDIVIRRISGTRSDGEFANNIKYYFGGADCDYDTIERLFKDEKEVYARIFFNTDLKIYRLDVGLTEETKDTVSGTVITAYDTNSDTKKENTVTIQKKDGTRETYTVTTRTSGDYKLVCELDDKAITLDDLGEEARIANVTAYITLNDNGRAYKIIARTLDTAHDVTLREIDGSDLIFKSTVKLNEKKLQKDQKNVYVYDIDKDCKYTFNGSSSSKKEIQSEVESAGSDYLKGTIVINKDDKIVSIDVQTENGAQAKTVSAVLKKATDFDYENREITVTERSSEKTYSLSSKAKTYYIINGVEFGSSEDKSGDPAAESFYKALRSYTDTDLTMVVNASGKVTKITADINDRYFISGEIKSYVSSARIMTVETSGGDRYTIIGDSDTQCFYNDKQYSSILSIGNYYEGFQERDSNGDYKYSNRTVKVRVYLTGTPSLDKVNTAALIDASH